MRAGAATQQSPSVFNRTSDTLTGVSVAAVAAAHEFGLNTTEVPYFRRALVEVEAILKTGRYRGLALQGAA